MAMYRVRKYWRGNPCAPVDVQFVSADSRAEAEREASRFEDTNHFAVVDRGGDCKGAERRLSEILEDDDEDRLDEEQAEFERNWNAVGSAA